MGTHCHPWCNPPIISEHVRREESYLSNLPRQQQFEKLKWLTEAIADRMSVRPTSFRAGRYGFSDLTAECLMATRIRGRFEPFTVVRLPEDGGPDYRMHTRRPHRLVDPSTQKSLIEIPVTTGFTRPGYERRRRIYQQARRPLARRLRLAGIADRLGVARRLKLSPEGNSVRDLQQLCRRRCRMGCKHSC